MSLIHHLRVVAAVSCLVPAANAQAILGAGVSGGGVDGRVQVDFVRETRTRSDSVHLAAVVYWRGADGWIYSHNTQESARAGAASDSLSRVSIATGTVGGGTVTAVARAWVQYDWRHRRLTVLDKQFSLPSGDSALVILADRIDGVGGPPTLQVFSISAPAQLDERTYLGTADEQRDALRARFASLTRAWSGFAEADPRVKAFLGRSHAP